MRAMLVLIPRVGRGGCICRRPITIRGRGKQASARTRFADIPPYSIKSVKWK